MSLTSCLLRPLSRSYFLRVNRNRLADSPNPYLRQHASNPVHWQPWDAAAFEEAQSRSVPIFLSIGYSACHWCHVMEHESFEDEEVAALLNERFVSIKVDREEMPDVDDAYMTAVQLATGHGGWPMSVFLTPSGDPFFAATYLPRESRGEYAGFKTILREISNSWMKERSRVVESASQFAKAIEAHRTAPLPRATSKLDWTFIDRSVSAVLNLFDSSDRGSEVRPKFPPHSAIRLLLWMGEYRRRDDCMKAATKLLDAMMMGGIHDHVGGGFHRYSTDENWLLPHFEKMLYDNALMLSNYATAYRLTSNGQYKYTADRIVAWLMRELMTSDGCFYCALDADSDGEEGLYYTWTMDEIREVLIDDAATFAKTYRMAESGNFLDEATKRRTGRNVPHLVSGEVGMLSGSLSRLLAARMLRVRPGLDDKVLTAWNGLTLSGLVAAGYNEAARKCADAILQQGTITHQVGAPGKPYLDAGYFIGGLLDLYDSTGDDAYKQAAASMFAHMADQHHDDEMGGWFFCDKPSGGVFGNTKPTLDSPCPSPNAVMVMNAIRLGRNDLAATDLAALQGWAERLPSATAATLHAAAEFLHRGGEVKSVPTIVLHALTGFRDGHAVAELRITIPDGWSLAGSLGAESGRESLICSPPDGFICTIPEAERHTGQVHLKIESEREIEQIEEEELELRWQLCTDKECLPPESAIIALRWTSDSTRT